MTRLNRMARPLVAAVAACLLGFGLAGCGAANPGAASVVNGTEISEDFVTQTAENWLAVTGQPVGRADTAVALSRSRMTVDGAAELGVVLTESEINEQLAAMLVETGAPFAAEDLAPGGREILGTAVVTTAVDQLGLRPQLDELIAASTVKLNPRYGVFEQGEFMQTPPLGDTISPAFDVVG